MKAAIVHAAGAPPVLGEIEAPQPQTGEQLVSVAASAISPLTRGRASGSHYSASGQFPFVAGVDGVGRLADGRRVYFLLPRAPTGGLGEIAAVASVQCIAVPDGIDDTLAAALANPGMSSVAALTERAGFVRGESVLVNGATGISGQLGVQIARAIGASRIVATGRDEATLSRLRALGADETIALGDDPAALDARFADVMSQGIDVVLDYLWGDSAQRLLLTAAKVPPEGKRLRFVQIGNSSGAEIALPGAVLRSAAIELLGSGLGSVPKPRLLAAIGSVFDLAAAGGITLPMRVVPFAQFDAAWADKGRERIVLEIARCDANTLQVAALSS